MTEGLKRLLILYTHMKSKPKDRGHKIFFFGKFNCDNKFDGVPNKCGTIGCILGEAPIVWPNKWRFTAGAKPALIHEDEDDFESNSIINACQFFSLSEAEAKHLFLPGYQMFDKTLLNHSPLRDVMKNFRLFIERKLTQQI